MHLVILSVSKFSIAELSMLMVHLERSLDTDIILFSVLTM
jgi:hypothetical protein